MSIEDEPAATRLPKEEMVTFGRCPKMDNFLLVCCEICGLNVKMQAFAGHMDLRHRKKQVEEGDTLAKTKEVSSYLTIFNESCVLLHLDKIIYDMYSIYGPF